MNALLAWVVVATVLWAALALPSLRILATLAGLALGDPALALSRAGLYLVQYVSLVRMQNGHTFDRRRLLAFPLFAVVGAACVVRGSWLQRRGLVSWKGREIQIH